MVASLVKSKPRGGRDPRTVVVERLQFGFARALSSDGATWYTVTLGDELACTCKGFEFRQTCCHIAAAVEKLGRHEVCYSCGTRLAVGEGRYRGLFNSFRFCIDTAECMRNRANGRELWGVL
jgi:hypothetical protein